MFVMVLLISLVALSPGCWVVSRLLLFCCAHFVILLCAGCPPVPWLPGQPGGESARTGRLLASHHPLATAHAGVYQLKVQQRQNQHQLHLQKPQLMAILLLDQQSTDTNPTHIKIAFLMIVTISILPLLYRRPFYFFQKNNFTMLT